MEKLSKVMYHVEHILLCVLPFNFYLFLELFNLKIAITLNSSVYKFYSNNIQHGKKLTVQHWDSFPRRTIYNVINRHDNEFPPERNHGSGRKAKIFTKAKIVQLEQLFHNNSKKPSDMQLKCLNSLLVLFAKH